MSTGPHQHFSLKHNGSFIHLNGAKLSGYKVHTGRDSYDSDCNYFWLEGHGQRYCAWSRISNPGVPDTNPNPNPNPNPDPDVDVLQNGKAVTSISGKKGAKKYFVVKVPQNAKNLSIVLDDGSGDADLYVKIGSKPTLTSWACRPYMIQQQEVCALKKPPANNYYIMINGYSNYENISVKASYDVK